jgi:biopolymer transport protein ExbD
MRRGLPTAKEQAPNLAPMVDVIMVILVFFIVGASLQLAREGVLRTELDPRSGPGDGVAIEIISSVKIGLANRPDGAGVDIVVMGAPISGSFAGLAALLRDRAAAGADTLNPVIIGAESDVRWQHVVNAMDATIAAGFRNVQFAVQLNR